MEKTILENNEVNVIGEVFSNPDFGHVSHGERFLKFDLKIDRLSDNSDIIPVIVSERLIDKEEFYVGTIVKIKGQFRSYNEYDESLGRSKLLLQIFVIDIENICQYVRTSEVILKGTICKTPTYRTTPFGREITDVMIAVNRNYNKSDYIPCICWGRNAKFCKKLKVGDFIKIVGRIQSRTYQKKWDDETAEEKIAYEVSISCIETI